MTIRLDSAPTQVQRFDAGPVGRPTRTPQGGLAVPAHLTRAGVFVYHQDGRTVREYRPPEEVFHADSLATLADAPVTDLHPSAPGMVTPATFRALARGHVRDVRQDGDRVAATAIIQDADLVTAVEAGARREVSCGYRCRMDATPGVTPTGEKYDAVQRDIRYNHVAVVPAGRAGSDVRLRLDAAGHQAPTGEPEGNRTMDSIRIDGVDYPLGTDAERRAATAAMVRYQAKLDTAAQTAAQTLTQTQAKLDAATAEATDLRAKLTAATDPARLDAAVRERASLHATAVRLLGTDAKPEAITRLDTLDADGLRRECIARVFPEVKLDGKDATYIAAMFDAATAKVRQDKAADPTGNGRALQVLQAPAPVRQDADPKAQDLTPQAARARMDAANREAWTAPLAFSRT